MWLHYVGAIPAVCNELHNSLESASYSYLIAVYYYLKYQLKRSLEQKFTKKGHKILNMCF
jgi:hypothetical protein